MTMPVRLEHALGLARETKDQEEKLNCLRAAITLSIHDPGDSAEIINKALPEHLYTKLLLDLLIVDDSIWNITTMVVLGLRPDPELPKELERRTRESADPKFAEICQMILDQRPPFQPPP